MATGGALDQRDDIQLLRAVAVAAVVAYHLHAPLAHGGFVGVDLFFVVSGYLITRLLLHEATSTHTVALGRFASRRIRRLLPASTLVVLVTLAALSVHAHALTRFLERDTGLAAVTFRANLALARQSVDYLTADRVSVFQHFWSLALEEQFYLVLPSVVLVSSMAARRRGWSPVSSTGAVLALLAVASFTLAVAETPTSPPDAFFLLQSRAWELLVGALVAVAELRGHRPSNRALWRAVGSVMVLAALAIGDDVPFPGPGALTVVVGTGALLWAGVDHRRRWDAPWTRPLHWVGDRSYAIYLWHWPPIVLLGLHDTPWAVDPLHRVAVVIGVVAVSGLSYALVEDPIRRIRVLGRTAPALGLGLGLTVVAVVATDAVLARPVAGIDGPPVAELRMDDLTGPTLPEPTELPANLAPTLVEALDERPEIYRNDCHQEPFADAPRPIDACTYGAPAGPVVVLVGDSHAAHWFEAAALAAERTGHRLVVMTRSSCSPLSAPTDDLDGQSCRRWIDRALEEIEALDPEVVLVGRLISRERRVDGTWTDDVRSGLARLRRATNGSVIYLGDTPDPDSVIPICLAEASIADCAVEEVTGFDAEQRAVARDSADGMVDATPLLCRDQRCPAVLGNVLVYRDASHLSDAMSVVLAPLLADAW